MKLMLLCIAIIFLYTVIPNFYYRNISPQIIRNLNTEKKEIALTFDDGPDSRYTNIILDILKKYDVKGTFFVVSENALKNKNIIKRIIDEGHSIGLHSLKHRSPWLSLPFQTKNDFYESLDIFKKMGISIRFYRPPWGTFNLLTQYFGKKLGLKTVLWSINGNDWFYKTTYKEVVDTIMNKIMKGDIILLHDSSNVLNNPIKTIDALQILIPRLKKHGYRFVTIGNGVGDLLNEKLSKGFL